MKLKFSAVLLALICIFALGFTACGKEDKTEWNVSADGGRVIASFSDNGKYGFILNVDGSGAMRGFSSKKEAPWYGKSGRITDIVISDGVTGIGANAFTDVKADAVIIPESVTRIGENAFNADTKICVYKNLSANGAKIYIYSQTNPAEAGDYWRLNGGVPEVYTVEGVKHNMKVLFIGNSFTYYNDIPALVASLAEGAGVNVTVESVTQGSWFLTKFADKNDEYGKIVDAKLTSSDDYDIVVLQEQSVRPIDNYAKFSEGATNLKNKIDATQKNCKIYLYSTWGYPEEAAKRNITIPEMELQLREAYDKLAGELGVSVSHVGKAFSNVYAEYPQYGLYHTDNRHPSYIGSFLSACVHAATILNIDPRTSTFTGTLDGETASLLKSAAWEAVCGS
ncbi:MAG: leucine-rich repeat protein [Clostridia bacterium]|nr:leucine-rich repeat protein [Clostridia bacterium]